MKKILNRPSRQRKNDLTDYRRSVQKAGQTYEQARKVMADVFEDLRAGGELDIPAVEQTIAPVIESVMTSTDAMTCVIRMREQDHYSYNHALATSIWVVVFGKYLGFDPDNLKALGMGGLLLDIGKTRIDSELLFKPPPLEPHELAEVRHHVEYGLEIFRESGKADSRIEDMIRTHHERHDGSGYPDGLSGHAIPVLGRIAGIVDCYNAMTSIRPHSAAKSTYHTMRHLLDQADALFQAEMVERFIQVVGIFPTATLIELNTGEVGVVVEQNRVRRLRPKVMLILDKEKQLRSDFGIIDLGALPSEKDLPDSVWILRGLEAGSFGIDPAEYYL